MALNLKGLAYRLEPVHLVRDGGQQFSADYTALNPQQLVPTLVHGDTVISQSMAMLEYLEDIAPSPALLPDEPARRAQVRAVAQAMACDIHPLNNLRVLKYLVKDLGLTEEAKLGWYRHWTESGLRAIEAIIEPHAGRYCFGNEITLADCCMVPQVYNAERFACNLDDMPIIRQVNQNLLALDAVKRASPGQQDDAEPA